MNYEIERNWLDPVRDLLPRAPRRHERVQGQLLAAAIDKAQARVPSISYSRRRAHYAKRGKRYDAYPDLYSYDLIVPNVDLLADVGLLQNEIAAADPTSGRQSTFRAAPVLIERLGDAPSAAARRKPRALIQLRDQDKLPIDYHDTDATIRMRRRLLSVNEMVESIRLEVPLDVADRRGDLLIIGDGAVNVCNNTLYRVFNINFKTGGRFYGHFVQGLPKEIRARLMLDGEPITEPDYPAHHLKILYALEGHPLSNDPYEVDGWERKIVKLALLIMINAPTWQKARGAIEHRCGLSRDEARRLVHALKRRHPLIAKHFQSGAGCWLQCYDSRMADRILIEATRQGIPVLPIHDSFVTPQRYQNRVLELMDTAFQIVMFGSRPPPAIVRQKQALTSKPFLMGYLPRSLPSSVLVPPPVLVPVLLPLAVTPPAPPYPSPSLPDTPAVSGKTVIFLALTVA